MERLSPVLQEVAEEVDHAIEQLAQVRRDIRFADRTHQPVQHLARLRAQEADLVDALAFAERELDAILTRTKEQLPLPIILTPAGEAAAARYALRNGISS